MANPAIFPVPAKHVLDRDGKYVGTLYDDGTIVDLNWRTVARTEEMQFVDTLPTHIPLSFADYYMSKSEIRVATDIIVLVIAAALLTGVR